MLVLLNDAEWARWSNSEIARRAAVVVQTVTNLRQPAAPIHTIQNGKYEPETRTFIHPKTGRETVMHTANIGRSHPAKAAQALPSMQCTCNAPHCTHIVV